MVFVGFGLWGTITRILREFLMSLWLVAVVCLRFWVLVAFGVARQGMCLIIAGAQYCKLSLLLGLLIGMGRFSPWFSRVLVVS